jgi:hypothetical protein
MNRYNKELISGILVFVILSIALASVTLLSPNVLGNVTNGTTKTYVNITNTEPFIYRLEVTPNPVILSPGGITNVTCTAYVRDWNGWQDFNNGTHNATLYDSHNNWNSADDKNYHYSNTSCGDCLAIPGDADGTNATCNCTFQMYYFANDTTWYCNFSISDKGGVYWFNNTRKRKSLSSNNVSNFTIDPLIAINVPSEVDYGELAVTENSSMIQANLTNYGNLHINLSVDGWGGDNETLGQNLSMICRRATDGLNLANISIEHEKYSVNANTLYNNMINLTSSPAAAIQNFTLYQRVDENTPTFGYDKNATYWRIYIPPGTTGFCNGTIRFTAQAFPGEPGAP